MAELTINLSASIHAEIIVENDFVNPNTPLLINPISKSYSDYAKLIYYSLEITNVVGLINPSLLINGKNSRFTSDENGSCDIELYIEDELGNSDTDIKHIIVA